MPELNLQHYPQLVDVIWDRVQGSIEERERPDFRRTEGQIVEALGLSPLPAGSGLSEGIAHAVVDLVDLGYFRGGSKSNSVRWSAVSPSPDAPDEAPSSCVLAQIAAVKLPTLRARVLRFLGETTLQHENGIAYYVYSRTPYDDMIQALFPDTDDTFQARGQIGQAVIELESLGFLRGVSISGGFTGRVTIQGACWLQIGAPLLDLIERAKNLPSHPEALVAANAIMEAHTRSERDAARDLTIAIEALRNAAGGEQQLATFLNRPPAFFKDLMQSAQLHRHATTSASEKLDHTQRLARAREIMDLYLLSCAVHP